MVGKTGARGKAKAKGQPAKPEKKTPSKPKGAAQKTPSKAAPSTPPTAAPAASTPSSSGLRRRANRRQLQEQAERAVKSKLLDHGYDRVLVETLRNKTGRSITEEVVNELARNGGGRKKLSSQFWSRIHSEFNLDHIFPADMEEALLPVHDDNPIERSVEPFERYLDWAPKHCELDVVAMLNAAVEGPIVKRKQSQRMMMALLKYFGKYNLASEYPRVWEAVRDAMDMAMMNHYKSSALARKNYILAHRTSLGALYSQMALDRIVQALDQNQIPPVADLQLVMGCATGSSMFHEEGVEVRHAEFVKTVEERLKNLLGNAYAEAEVSAFQQLCLAESKALTAGGIKSFDKKTSVFPFLGHEVTCPISSINDEWSWRLLGDAKTIAVSRNLVQRLPWEILCFGKAPLAGVSETVTPPESLLHENRNARDACLALFDGSGRIPTFVEMRAKLTGMQEELKSADRSFAQELCFFFNCAEGIVESMVRGQVLGAFPASDRPRTVAHTLGEVKEVKRSNLVLCSDSSLQKEVEAVVLFLGQLADKQCPASAMSPSTSKFFAQVLEKAEGFVTAPTQEKVGVFLKNIEVRGKAAVEVLWKEYLGKDFDIGAEELQTLRTYQWMLTQDQQKRLQDTIAKSVVAARNALVSQKALTAGPEAEGGSAAASSSSTSLVAAAAAVALSSNKRKMADLAPSSGAATSAAKASKSKLHSIFRGRRGD